MITNDARTLRIPRKTLTKLKRISPLDNYQSDCQNCVILFITNIILFVAVLPAQKNKQTKTNYLCQPSFPVTLTLSKILQKTRSVKQKILLQKARILQKYERKIRSPKPSQPRSLLSLQPTNEQILPEGLFINGLPTKTVVYLQEIISLQKVERFYLVC